MHQRLLLLTFSIGALECSIKIALHPCTMQVKTHTVTLDLQDIPKVEKLVPELPAAFQDVDVLVNNAGLSLVNSNLIFVSCALRLLAPASAMSCMQLSSEDKDERVTQRALRTGARESPCPRQ